MRDPEQIRRIRDNLVQRLWADNEDRTDADWMSETEILTRIDTLDWVLDGDDGPAVAEPVTQTSERPAMTLAGLLREDPITAPVEGTEPPVAARISVVEVEQVEEPEPVVTMWQSLSNRIRGGAERAMFGQSTATTVLRLQQDGVEPPEEVTAAIDLRAARAERLQQAQIVNGPAVAD